MAFTARQIVELLELSPHPEGGWFKETWRADAAPGTRASGTAIYYLLEEGQRSHWHRIDAAEIWHFYAGAALRLSLSEEGARSETITLGAALETGERPQAIVPPGWWQSAESLGPWTLVGCTVSPGFRFEDFEMAQPNWRPDND